VRGKELCVKRSIVKELKRAGGVALVTLSPLLQGCWNSCFVRGTRIATPRGPRPIEALAVGEIVWSWDVERSAAVERPVARVLRAQRDELLTLRAGDVRIAGVTLDHPFYEQSTRRFVRAGELSLDARLLAWLGTGDPRPVQLDALERVARGGPVDVWDLTIDGPEHDFFAEGVLVHNKSPLEPPDAGTDAAADASDRDGATAEDDAGEGDASR
jgi:hypothetical protein